MTQMVKYKDYIAGWLDTSIHDFVLSMPSAYPSMQYALVTCLDSSRDLSTLIKSSSELTGLKDRAGLLGDGLLLRTSDLIDHDGSHRIFFGFDEVFFFPSDEILPRPAGPGLVGPDRVSQSRIESIGEWMNDNSCTLALGDGDGLNFVLRAHGLVRYFIGSTLRQPTRTSV